ncbi:MAG: MarR family transcriptional regulator [Lachnospiraceae bacterium]|nr:MarR family transcriptional regulator [Lachnospiraceae bacterium]MDD3659516.1 MarR family transcriptional regulator [Lachnospiraceae bacterium]
MDINRVLNELLVSLFKDINEIEEKAIQTEEFQGITTNDVHVMEAIGTGAAKNMSTVAKALGVTMGTLTISVNSLVKKGYVQRTRSDEDRRVVLVSLTERGRHAHEHHRIFHERMITEIVQGLSPQEKEVLSKTLHKLIGFFKKKV